MAAPPAFVNTVLDALVTALTPIASPSTSWLTVPDVPVVGVPADTVGVLRKPKLFVAFVNAERDEAASGSRHYWNATFSVYCVARDLPTCISLHADAVRALYAAEAAMTALTGQPAYPQSFSIREDLQNAGAFVGVLSLSLYYSTDHSAS